MIENLVSPPSEPDPPVDPEGQGVPEGTEEGDSAPEKPDFGNEYDPHALTAEEKDANFDEDEINPKDETL